LLLRDGVAVPLTLKAFDTLLVLVENSGHTVEKVQLLNKVWPDAFVEENTLTSNISTLRKALGKASDGQEFIQTVPRRGYRFIAGVREIVDASGEMTVEEHSRSRVIIQEDETTDGASGFVGFEPPIESELVSSLRAKGRPRWRTRRLTLVGVAILFGLGSVAALLRLSSKPNAPSPDTATRSIATLPLSFENYSWDKLSSSDSRGQISQDGQFLVYLANNGDGTLSLRQRRLASLDAVTILPNIKSSLWGAALTHDGSFVYYILADDNGDTGTLYRVSVLGGTPRKILEHINGGPSLSPDDQRVAFMRANVKPGVAALITANTSDGSDERVLELESDVRSGVYNAVWFPDGLRLLCMKVDQRADGTYWYLAEIPATGGAWTQITQPQKQHFWWDAWLPDGSGILMIASDPVSSQKQLYVISYPDGSMHRLTNDLNSYMEISVSADGSKLVTNQVARQNGVWIASATDIKHPVSIGRCCVDRVAWTPDGHIVYDAFERGMWHLWTMEADGAHQQQLSPDDAIDWSPSVSRDGRYIVFLSSRSGRKEIWRTDSDGRNPRQLTNTADELSMPSIAPDGQMVYFGQFRTGGWIVARVSIDGGDPELVADDAADLWDISPDGERLAYSFFDDKVRRWRVAVRPLEGDDPKTILDFAPADVLVWTADGMGLIYKDKAATEPSTLWRQSISGGQPQPLLSSAPETVYWANWSADGKQLALIRGKIVTSIVMLKQSAPR